MRGSRRQEEREQQHDQGDRDREATHVRPLPHRRAGVACERGGDHGRGRGDDGEVVVRIALTHHELDPAAGEPSEQRDVNHAGPAIEIPPRDERVRDEHAEDDEDQRTMLVVRVRRVPALRQLLREAEADGRVLVAGVHPPTRPERSEAAGDEIPQRCAEEAADRAEDRGPAQRLAPRHVGDAFRDEHQRGDTDRRGVDRGRDDRLHRETEHDASGDRGGHLDAR